MLACRVFLISIEHFLSSQPSLKMSIPLRPAASHQRGGYAAVDSAIDINSGDVYPDGDLNVETVLDIAGQVQVQYSAVLGQSVYLSLVNQQYYCCTRYKLLSCSAVDVRKALLYWKESSINNPLQVLLNTVS